MYQVSLETTITVLVDVEAEDEDTAGEMANEFANEALYTQVLVSRHYEGVNHDWEHDESLATGWEVQEVNEV
jgi:hypothetical protein